MAFAAGRPLNVAVVLGGTSEERLVSLASGRGVIAALRERGHEVTAIDPAVGAVPREDEERCLGTGVGEAPPGEADLAELARTALGPRIADVPELRAADVVFLALHGDDGEDGRIQAVLDLAGVPYTGTGCLGSAIAFDKRVSKELMATAGIPTPAWTPRGASEDAILRDLGLPLVVKPSNGGSTVGLTVVREAGELGAALALAARYDEDVLAEAFVPGRELTVTVLEGRALPVVEIIPGHEIYDYESKYTPGMSSYEVPARLDPADAARLAELALATHEVLRQGAYGRVDFRRDERDGTLHCLETNSLPGLTATSLVPKAAAAAGIGFGELCERIALAALRDRT
ncbi:MAG: D-alanine--D-alanine ligase [Gemmatimonadota bacterium]